VGLSYLVASELSAVPFGEFIAQSGCEFILFLIDSFTQSFLQRLAD
jgi:hypothetical protein